MMRKGIKYNKDTKRYYINTNITLSNRKVLHFKYKPQGDEFRNYRYIERHYHSIIEERRTLEEEKIKAEAKKLEHTKIKPVVSTINTVTSLFDKFLDFRSGEMKPATIKNYGYIFKNNILPISGDNLEDFYSDDCVINIRTAIMKKDVANGHKRRVIFVLKELIDYSRKIKLIDSNKKDDLLTLLTIRFGVENKKESKNKYTSLEDAIKVFEATENPFYRDVFILLYFSSLRIGEFLGIKVSDIEFISEKDKKEYAQIKIQRQMSKDSKLVPWLKNGMSFKYIYYFDDTVTTLKKFIKTNKLKEDDMLIKSTRTSIARYLDISFKKAGVEHNSLHGFGRKSINTELYKSGADSKTRSALLGQESQKVNDVNYVANSEAREKAKEYLQDVVSRIKEQKDDIKK